MPSCGPACDDGENLPEHRHPVAFACKAEGLWSDTVQLVPFEVGADGGSCCSEVVPLLWVVVGVAEREEEQDHFVELDDVAVVVVAVEEVAVLRREESYRPVAMVAVVELVAEE